MDVHGLHGMDVRLVVRDPRSGVARNLLSAGDHRAESLRAGPVQQAGKAGDLEKRTPRSVEKASGRPGSSRVQQRWERSGVLTLLPPGPQD